MSVRDLLPWRHVVPLDPRPPAKPEWERLMDEIVDARVRHPRSDLVAESRDREQIAEARAAGIPGCTLKSETAGWPDPHGPDPVVFGDVPRVRETC